MRKVSNAISVMNVLVKHLRWPLMCLKITRIAPICTSNYSYFI